ncbi:uncharacterized protein Ufm1 isoform X1 [Epargyreus clarus]|uniref:uncharacterized protein Ufm1 isoform X1 n=1 Tax=Epargyreus clarus TaxID=520877 RepID=UPI003C2EF5C8
MAAICEVDKFFKDFIGMCVSRSWPDATTTPENMLLVFSSASHIEEIVKKLSVEKERINEFMSLLTINVCIHNTDYKCTDVFLQNCLADPPKYVLKKIINSEADDEQVETAFKLFQNMFSEQRLINSLSDLMVESASKHTLLNNMTTELPEHVLVEFRSKLYLAEIMACDANEDIVDLLKHCEQPLMDLLVLSLLRDNQQQYANGVDKIIACFVEVMFIEDGSTQTFWESLFNIEKENFIQMCLKNDHLCQIIFNVLKDCWQDVPNSRVKLTKFELDSIIKKFCENSVLELDFMDYMEKNGIHVNV